MVTRHSDRAWQKVEVLHVNLPFSLFHTLTRYTCSSGDMPLNDQQRDALEQLWSVTASTSDAARQRDERMLTENGFDVQVRHLPFFPCLMLMVQRTVEQIFAMGEDSPVAGSRSGSRETFEFEDVNMARPAGSRRLSGTTPRRQGSGNVASTGLNLWSAITLPVRLIVSILSGTWYLLST